MNSKNTSKKKNKIIVFGGAGYLGSILVPKLEQYYSNIIVADTFWFWNNEKEFIEKCKLKKTKTIKIDIREKRIEKLIDSETYVINLACLSNDYISDMNIKKTWEISYHGVLNIINSSLKKKAKKIIQISTTNVYGSQNGKTVDEEDEDCAITTYSKIKAEIDHYLINLMKYQKTDISILRLGTLYGYSPKLKTDIVINAFIKKIIDENSIFIHGGEQKRPFLHVEDASKAIIECLKNKKSKNQLFNVAAENFSINEIVKIILKVEPNIQINRQAITDQKSFTINNNKIVKTLNFKFDKNINNSILDMFYKFKNEIINWDMTITANVLKNII